MSNKQSIRKILFDQQNCHCYYCHKLLTLKGGQENSLTIDHFIPKSKGGASKVSNYVASCGDCNNRKSNNEIYNSPKPGNIEYAKTETYFCKLERVYSVCTTTFWISLKIKHKQIKFIVHNVDLFVYSSHTYGV